jgi:hypothetical protein
MFGPASSRSAGVGGCCSVAPGSAETTLITTKTASPRLDTRFKFSFTCFEDNLTPRVDEQFAFKRGCGGIWSPGRHDVYQDKKAHE